MRKNYNKVQGSIGEIDAVEFLKKKGYKVLETNYTNKLGEIDIIAKDKNVIVFVEVKRRSTLMYGRPIEAVNFYKQQKIKKVAEFYLMKNNMIDANVRFDVIEILDKQIEHIENAFM